jgi:hypothetical protein
MAADFSLEPAVAAGAHARYRVAEAVLAGASYVFAQFGGGEAACAADYCPERAQLFTANLELHPLHITDVPVLDPWLGVGVGPVWSTGSLSPERAGASAVNGMAEFAAGFDVHVAWLALGAQYRAGLSGGWIYSGPFARLQVRL